MRWIAAPAVLILALAAALHFDEKLPDGVDLVIVNRGDIFTLDPQRMTYLKDMRMAFALFEGLVRWNNDDFTIEPAAAIDLPHISEDGRTYTFTIRSDARWSNGDPLTAHDIVWSFRRALLPDTASYYSAMLFAIEGAKEFFDWRAAQTAAFTSGDDAEALWLHTLTRFDELVHVKALGEHTLRITLAQPRPYFLDILAMPIAMPVHPPTVQAHMRLNSVTGRIEQRHDWCKAGMLISNGPYQLERWRFRRDMLLARNPHFHSPDRVMSDSVLALTIDDAATAALAFESGAIDWLPDVGAEHQVDMLAQRFAYEDRHRSEIDSILARGMSIDDALASMPPPLPGAERRNIHIRPSFGVEFFSFNCRPTLGDGRPNPFADVRVRRAFVMSIDREAIVRQVTRLNEPIATTITPRGSIPGYEPPEGLGFNPEHAREELRAAGWNIENHRGARGERGEKNELNTSASSALSAVNPFPVVEILWTTNNPRFRWIALELKSQWERNLGIQVELRGVETRFYREDLRNGNFMIARGTWYGDYGDPTTFLNLFQSADGNNHRRYASEYVDSLLAQAANERDPDARFRILEECERFLFQEEVPMLMICQLVQVSMHEPGKLTGLSTHPRQVQYYWRMQTSKR